MSDVTVTDVQPKSLGIVCLCDRPVTTFGGAGVRRCECGRIWSLSAMLLSDTAFGRSFLPEEASDV